MLTEKPLEISLEAADRCMKACRRAGVTLGVCFQRRMSPDNQAVKSLLAAGKLGRVYAADLAVKFFREQSYMTTARLTGAAGPLTAGARSCSSRLSLALAALRAAQSQGELVAIVDVADAFDPGTARVDLSRLLWVRPKNVGDGLLSMDRILDAGGFGAAVLYLGNARVRDGAGPRLQRRAEQAKCALLVVGERAQLGSFSAAALELRRARPRWSGGGLQPLLLDGAYGRVEVTRNKLGPPGDTAQLELAL